MTQNDTSTSISQLCDMLAEKTRELLTLIERKDYGPRFNTVKKEVVRLQVEIRYCNSCDTITQTEVEKTRR